MNRHERRRVLKDARKRKSWEWEERHLSEADLARFPAMKNLRTAFVNDLYSVQMYSVVTAWGLVEHLVIREHANNREPPWRDLQRIKNELVGPERVAIQVYPADKTLVDQADLYHLWVLPEGMEIPFGLHRECGFSPSSSC